MSKAPTKALITSRHLCSKMRASQPHVGSVAVRWISGNSLHEFEAMSVARVVEISSTSD